MVFICPHVCRINLLGTYNADLELVLAKPPSFILCSACDNTLTPEFDITLLFF
jgi:hypothetical protein